MAVVWLCGRGGYVEVSDGVGRNINVGIRIIPFSEYIYF